jgi:hypothetical protein
MTCRLAQSTIKGVNGNPKRSGDFFGCSQQIDPIKYLLKNNLFRRDAHYDRDFWSLWAGFVGTTT